MSNNLFLLTEHPSVANHFLSELRDASVQKDRMRFRKNLERLGEIMAFEISKMLPYTPVSITTPLGRVTTPLLREHPLLVTILRAGLPFHQGFLNVFDHADSGFVGAWRNEDVKDLEVNVDYVSAPLVEGRHLIFIDPMLATGQSFLKALSHLLSKGRPAHLFIASVVAAPEGIAFLERNIAVPYTLCTCAVDKELNSSFYIVPGLGDAGDLCYGVKD
jgi:uracil phosphoribosyltransferase